jgi:SulP family sulfate permease
MAPTTQKLITGMSAGLIAGIRTILGSAAMVTLVMPTTLGTGIAPALDVILIGGAVLAALVALLSTYPGAVAQVQDGPAVIIGVMAATLAASLKGQVSPETIVLLVLASINVAAFTAGAVFYGLGVYRLGALVRFIPYPVIGGFLAGSGLLILLGAGPVLTGVEWSRLSFALLSEPMRLARWLPGLAFGIALVLILRRFSHALLVPALLFGAVLIYHLALTVAGVKMADAQAASLLLGPFPEGAGLSLPAWTRLPAEEWRVLVQQIPTFGAIVLVSVVALLLNASGLELATGGDLDINRELRATGIANMVSGALGGAVGFHALSASLLGFRMGANSRVIGITCAAMCAIALLAGTSLLAYMPKAVLGGLLFSMGAGLLIEWLWDGARRLPRQDYAIVLLIVGVIGSVGILAGVLTGIAVAMAIFVLSYSRVRVIRQELSGAEYRSNVDRSPAALEVLRLKGESIRVVKLEGFIFFGTAYSVMTQIHQRLVSPGDRPLKYLLLDFRDVPAIDSSAMSAFAKIHSYCTRADCELIFTRMSEGIERQFRAAGLDKAIGDVRIFADLDLALEYCEEKLLAGDGNTTIMGGQPIWARIEAALPEGTPLSAFMAYLQPRTFREGEYLLKQGGPPDEIVFIESGRVTVRLTFPDGRSIRLRSMTMGTMIGEIGLYLNQPRSASAIADHAVQAYILTAEKLREMEKNDPPLANALHYVIVALLSERLAGTNGLLQRLIN